MLVPPNLKEKDSRHSKLYVLSKFVPVFYCVHPDVGGCCPHPSAIPQRFHRSSQKFRFLVHLTHRSKEAAHRRLVVVPLPLRGTLKGSCAPMVLEILASSEQTEQGSFKKKLTMIDTAAAIVRNGCSPRLHGSRKLTRFKPDFFPHSAAMWSSKGGGRFNHARYYYCQAHRFSH